MCPKLGFCGEKPLFVAKFDLFCGEKWILDNILGQISLFLEAKYGSFFE
jgi:hypothetical protein